MTSEIKVNKVSDSCGSALVTKCGSTITLGASGKTVAIASGASTSGMGRTGAVDWCTTAKTSPFSGVNGQGYFVNTEGGAVTITLPASPSAGDIVAIKDYKGTFQTNALTIGRNGSKLNQTCLDSVVSERHKSLTMIYVDATVGWKSIEEGAGNIGDKFLCASGGTKITSGDYTSHIFTADDTLTVNSISNISANNVVDYLVVGGGGGGGQGADPAYMAGGAGAGGFRLSNDTCMSAPVTSPLATPTGITLGVGSVPITVGAGGARASGDNSGGSNGNNSVFSTITSAGGGKGGGGTGPDSTGGNGGSGGGGTSGGGGGTGNTPPVSPPQGQNGSTSPPGNTNGGGAGGGAGAAGAFATPTPGKGGIGGIGSYVDNSMFGASASSYGEAGPVSNARYFAGGGSGASNSPEGPGNVSGGIGGGGDGGTGNPSTNGGNGSDNTGGGAGGGSGEGSGSGLAGIGGSGIIVIRYKSNQDKL